MEGEIIGVVSFEQYISCIGCKGKVTEETNMMGECNKCKMKVKLSRCTPNATANVVFQRFDGVKLNFFVFYEELEKMVTEIDDHIESWEEKFLCCLTMKISINNKNIVTSLSII